MGRRAAVHAASSVSSVASTGLTTEGTESLCGLCVEVREARSARRIAPGWQPVGMQHSTFDAKFVSGLGIRDDPGRHAKPLLATDRCDVILAGDAGPEVVSWRVRIVLASRLLFKVVLSWPFAAPSSASFWPVPSC
jgi:hypothetical protein